MNGIGTVFRFLTRISQALQPFALSTFNFLLLTFLLFYCFLSSFSNGLFGLADRITKDYNRVMKIRLMQPQDVPAIAHWMVELPLWQRYAVSEADMIDQFNAALRGHDLLLVTGETDPVGFAWCLRGGAFGRSDYLRLIGVRADFAGQGLARRC